MARRPSRSVPPPAQQRVGDDSAAVDRRGTAPRREPADPSVAPPSSVGVVQAGGTDRSDRLTLSGRVNPCTQSDAAKAAAYGRLMQRALSPSSGTANPAVTHAAPAPPQVFPDRCPGGDTDHHREAAVPSGEVFDDPKSVNRPLLRSSSAVLQCSVPGCPLGVHSFDGRRKTQLFVAHLRQLVTTGVLDDEECDRLCGLQRERGVVARPCPTCNEWFGSLHYLREHRKQCSLAQVPPRTPIATASSPTSARMGRGGDGEVMSPAEMQPRVAVTTAATGGGHATQRTTTGTVPVHTPSPRGPSGRARAVLAGAVQPQVEGGADGSTVPSQSHEEDGEPAQGAEPDPSEGGHHSSPSSSESQSSDEDSDEDNDGDPNDVEADADGNVLYVYEPVERVTKRVETKLRRKVKRLDHFPPWMTLKSEVQAMIQLALEDILDASNPESFFQAWQAFFDLPDRAFVQSNLGGRKRQRALQVGLAARDWINLREAGQLGDLPAESDGDDDQLDPAAVEATREQYDRDASRIRAMKKLLKRNQVSRAFAKLTSDSIPPASEATFDKLLPLFPPGDLTRNPKKPDDAVPLIVGDHTHVLSVIKSVAGKSAGPSGWAPDLFLIMEDNQRLLEMYGQCLALLANRSEWRTPDLVQLLTGARLLAVPKPGRDEVRPIAVSEATFSHLQLLAYRQIDEKWLVELFSDLGRVIQFGVGVPAGVEKAFKTIEAGLLCAHDREQNGPDSDWASLLLDAKSAYQHMSREAMLKAIYKHRELEPIWGVAELVFDWASPRYVQMTDGTVRVIVQSEGTPQGSIISPVSWCLAELKTLTAMTRAGCQAPRERNTMAAVQDDQNGAGSHRRMLAVLDVAKKEFPKLNLELNLEKSVVVCSDLSRVDADMLEAWQEENIDVKASAKLLGGCLSSADAPLLEFLAERIDPDRANGFSDALRRLGHPDMDPQSAKLVATIGVQHALDYYLRLFPPSVVRPLLRKFDKALLDVMVSKLGLTEMFPDGHLPEWDQRLELLRQQLTLPRRHAGLGLRPSADVCLAAYLASLAACATEILSATERTHLHLTGRQLHDEDSPNAWLPERYKREYNFCRGELVKLAPTLDDLTFSAANDPDGADQLEYLPPYLYNFLRMFHETPALKVKFQARLLEPVWVAQREGITASLSLGPDPQLAAADRARLDAWSRPTAGRALHVIPTSDMTTFTPDEYVQIVREMLGLMPAAHFYLIQGPIKCREGDGVDLKSCPTHSGRLCASTRRGPTTVTHDGVAEVLCTIASRNLVQTTWTPYLETGKATDVGFSFVDKFVQADVTVRAADAPSYAAEVAKRGVDGVLHLADESKDKKYARLVNKKGVEFVALSFLNSGAHGKPVGQLLKRICNTGEALGATRPVDIKTARDWIAITIARGRARAAMAATARMRAVGPLYKEARAAKRRNRARRLARLAFGGGDEG